MIDYIAQLYVKALILLSCIGWAALVFWGAIYFAEKILRIVYQDAPQQLFQDEPPAPAAPACVDCGGLHPLNADQQCDLCAAITTAREEAARDELIWGPAYRWGPASRD